MSTENSILLLYLVIALVMLYLFARDILIEEQLDVSEGLLGRLAARFYRERNFATTRAAKLVSQEHARAQQPQIPLQATFSSLDRDWKVVIPSTHQQSSWLMRSFLQLLLRVQLNLKGFVAVKRTWRAWQSVVNISPQVLESSSNEQRAVLLTPSEVLVTAEVGEVA